MIIHKISRQAAAFAFDNIESFSTYIYLLEKSSRYYLIDTCCGEDSIRRALDQANINPEKETVIINTHFHWDHVWGNGYFKDNIIIGHELCGEFLNRFWDSQLEQNGRYQDGPVEKVLPNWTFTKKILLKNDGLEIFHSPGHTRDSISVFDHRDKILYAGDNLEKPIVYVESDDLQAYIKTLEKYLSYKPKKIFAGHTLDLTEKDILNTLGYLQALQAGVEVLFHTEYERSIHEQNLKTVYGSR